MSLRLPLILWLPLSLSRLRHGIPPRPCPLIRMASAGAASGAASGHITFHEMPSEAATAALAALPRPIVHLKGFAGRVLLPSAAEPPEGHGLDLVAERGRVAAAATALLEAFHASGAKTLVFDGDHFAPDSFASLVPALAADGAVVVAAIMLPLTHGGEPPPARREQFEEAWAGRGVDISCFTLPQGGLKGDDYAQLGVSALQATGAERVFCFGGGSAIPTSLPSGQPCTNVRSTLTARAGVGCQAGS